MQSTLSNERGRTEGRAGETRGGHGKQKPLPLTTRFLYRRRRRRRLRSRAAPAAQLALIPVNPCLSNLHSFVVGSGRFAGRLSRRFTSVGVCRVGGTYVHIQARIRERKGGREPSSIPRQKYMFSVSSLQSPVSSFQGVEVAFLFRNWVKNVSLYRNNNIRGKRSINRIALREKGKGVLKAVSLDHQVPLASATGRKFPPQSIILRIGQRNGR